MYSLRIRRSHSNAWMEASSLTAVQITRLVECYLVEFSLIAQVLVAWAKNASVILHIRHWKIIVMDKARYAIRLEIIC